MLDDVSHPSPFDTDHPDGTAARSRPRPDVALRFLAKDVADGAWNAGLDFLCVDAQRAQEIVPRAMLNNASALADGRAKRACRLPPDRQGQLALARKLAASEPDRHLRLTCTTGYFDGFLI